MAYPEVVALLGKPASSQQAQGRLVVRWNLHVAFKGNVPYDLEFNARTRRLLSWKANEEEYRKEQQRLAAAFGMPPPAPDEPATDAPATAGNSGSWTGELAGKKIVLIQSGTGFYSSKSIALCRTGVYRQSGESGHFGSGRNFSAATSGNHQASGRWQASGSLQNGTLVLRGFDGSQQQFRIAIRDDKLFLDGTRWLRDAAGC
jgi:hypothetical protein